MPARSCPEWESSGTEEWNPADRWESPVATIPPPPAVSSLPLEQQQDPQPFNINAQLQTGITDWINLRALGAKGDGIADDTGIFQAANLIAQLPPGRMIYIPAGTYRLTTGITFSSGVQWLLMGTVTGAALSGGTQLQFGNPGSGMANPMTGAGDLIVGGSAGSPSRLAAGANGTQLQIVSGSPAWVVAAAGGMTNPMTAKGDLIYSTDSSGDPGRLAIGAAGAQLQVATSGIPAWVIPPAVLLSPSGDNTGVTDAAHINTAVSGLSATGGTIALGPGVWYVKTGQVTVLQQNATTYLAGAGAGATFVYAVGSGDVFRMYNPNTPSGGFPGLTVYGGGVSAMTIDGTNATAGACGLHIGDGEHYVCRDLQIQHFNLTGSSGLHIDNSVWWTEKGIWEVTFVDNTISALVNITTGAPSWAENDFYFTIFANANQTGIQLQNGGTMHGSRIRTRGVFNGAVSNTGLFLQLGNGVGNSIISNSWCDIQMNLGSGGTFTPAQTININGGQFTSNYGRLVFEGAENLATGWTPSNIDFTSQNSHSFFGDILGDPNLAPASSLTSPNQPCLFLAGSPVIYAKNRLDGGAGTIYDWAGDAFQTTLSASITIGLGQSGSKGCAAGPQRKVIRIKQAAGSSFTVTWPSNGSPTTSSPTVVWAGGTAPVMTPTHGAVDYYFLDTIDGATWCGRAEQNVS